MSSIVMIKHIETLRHENKALIEKLNHVVADNAALKRKLHMVSACLTCRQNTNGINNNETTSCVLCGNKGAASQKVITCDRDPRRLEELETRLTEQSFHINRLTMTQQRIEDALNSIKLCNSITEVRDAIRKVQFEILGPELNDKHTILTTLDIKPVTEVETEVKSDNRKYHISIPKIVPPKSRLSGDTHISLINRDLKDYISTILNRTKPNGNDWRMLARRLGIPEETIKSWSRQHCPSPMEQLWGFWSEREGATVRLLHRHVASPDIKNVSVTAWIAKFYDVD